MKKKILAIDDEQDIRSLIKEILKDKYDVFVAKNVKEGLKIFKDKNIDLVLLDVLMPGMTAKQCIEKIFLINKKTKIAYLTVVEFSKKEINNLKKKKIEYISKPFEPENLIKEVGKILNN